MNKKFLLPLLTVLLLVAIIIIGILQYRSQRSVLTENIPLISTPTPRPQRPVAEITRTPAIPEQVDITAVTKQIPHDVSLAEKDKVVDFLPIRQENFTTTTSLKTTINIFSFPYDPISSIRLEIYGINYNNPELTGPNAVAFKDSFLEAKKRLVAHGVVLKNLQIIYGNRQYIQDTATYWVKTFKLID